MDFSIKHIESVESTNQLANDLINQSGLQEGTVIWADEQIHGKGHAGNSWESEKGKNLTFSLVLKPVFIPPAEQFIITKMISVAIRKVVLKFLPQEAVKIKWPNDIYIIDDKVAGILIQNILKGNEIEYTVIGIGLNINQEKFNSDAPNPVSLIHYSGEVFSVEDILSKMLVEIGAIYDQSASKSYLDDLDEAYLENLYRYKQLSNFRQGKKIFKATLEGIGEYGRLKLKGEDDKISLFEFKEVEFV